MKAADGVFRGLGSDVILCPCDARTEEEDNVVLEGSVKAGLDLHSNANLNVCRSQDDIHPL